MSPLNSSVAVLVLALARTHAADGFSFKDNPGQSLDVLHDGKIVARYMDGHDVTTPAARTETYKPFLHVFDAQGTGPITKGAGGAFTHHRGIFIGWNKITVDGKGYDRWHMTGGDQIHEKFITQKAEKDRATFTSAVRWTGATPDSTLIEEERTLTFLPAPAPAYALIDMVSKIKAVAGETVLDGDPEHAGLHFRPADEVDRKQTKYLYPKDGAQPHKDVDYPWFGETYSVKGKTYSVVYLNHPGNPTGGRISAYRDYGRFGAFWKTTVPAGETKEFRARFLVTEGELPTPEAIQKLWNDYTGKNDPTPATTAKTAEFGSSPDEKKPAPKKPEATPAPAPDPVPETTEPANAPAPAAGPRRAGGGPENPELKFKLPPPPVLTPEEELKTIKVAPGFKVELVASEPMIETPTALTWDDQGRMYVLEMRDYMHDVDGTGEDQPTGRVSRLEDTDGDGVMDKRTIFADNLLMPRAVMAVGDGALIAEPPNLVFYRDKNGDGIADAQEPVSDKYASKGGQPEHMANSPTWMMDNWIWSTGYGLRFRYQQGKFTSEAVQGFGQWGRTQDDWGRQYFNYNSDFLRSDLVSPNLYARNPRVTEKTAINFQVMRDQTVWPSGPTPGVNRGYSGILRDDGSLKSCTATCGAAIYRGDLFAPEYRGNAFIPEPSGNLVKRVIINEADGMLTGKNAAEGTEFMRSTDERFRPVNAYTGPDGALYIVDMGRGVIQHKGFLTYYLVANIKDRKLETPVNLGRIYRIVPDGAKPTTVKLPKDTAQIVPLLAHANGWVRDTAQRVLVERADASAAAAVKKLASDAKSPQARVQALCTLDGLGALTPDVLVARLHDGDEHVRTAAVRLADRTLATELAKIARDPSAMVRLQLAFNLSTVPGPEAESALVTLLEQGGNPALAEAVASGMMGRELEFLEVLLKQPGSEKIAGTGIFDMLASCVMKERRASRISRALDLAAGQSANPTVQLAMLTGLAGKAPAKGAAPGNLIKLDAEPAALASLMANPKAKSLVARVESQLGWVGKPGYVPPPPIVPLTPPQQALFEKGKAIYATICGACHQPNGAGMAGLAPPLLNSEWALGPVDRPIKIALGGLTGPIDVAGTKWQLEMPGLPVLSDDDIAGVLTYIRREWEHGASPVAPSDVAKVRAATKDRTKAWTAEELSPKPAKAEAAKAK